MGSWLREALFGNWRNKGVALFFAVTIWYVAFQSEFRSGQPIPITVELVPDRQDRVILRQSAPFGGSISAFTGNVTLHINASRKHENELRDSLPDPDPVVIPVDSTRDQHFFSKDDLTKTKELEFLRFSLLTIKEFSPDFVNLEFDDRAEKELPIEVKYAPQTGWESEIERVEPAKVRLSGPRTILDRVRVVAEATLRQPEMEFPSGPVTLKVLPETLDGLDVRSLVGQPDPPQATLTVRLRRKQKTLPVKAVRIRFLVPPVKYAFRINFGERTLPIKFKGPESEIARLEQEIEKPDFYVVVPVLETGLDPEKESSLTFTEDDLLLVGFSKEIQMLQHEDREVLGAWSYTVVPVVQSQEE